MNFIAGIITENEHEYNALTGEKAKMVRLIEDRGYQITKDGAYIYVTTYAQIIDEEGNESLIKKSDSTSKIPLLYTNEEIDSFFSSFNNPIEPTDSYTGETRSMIQSVLLADTMMKGYFNGDTCLEYVPVS